MLSGTRFRSLNLKKLDNYKNALKLINPNCCFLFLSAKTLMEETPSIAALSVSSPSRQFHGDSTIGLQEWQSWGTSSPVPSMVSEIVEDLKLLEKESNAQITFGGHGGKIQGELKITEDKKHRAKYQSLKDSEEKIQFFSARQVACRLLGSRGYLCQKCWLPREDCMCSRIRCCTAWEGMRFWVYMHPKIFGVQAASLSIFGIIEHEEIMWNEFMRAGKENVWCLYPNKDAAANSVQDIFGRNTSTGPEIPTMMATHNEIMHFILIDGTWSNSAAMFRRLKERANLVWKEDLPCISLTTGASAMHKLRPQPSWDRTCTAAAAASLLFELQSVPQFSSIGLEEHGEAVEEGLETLLEALTTRRVRKGRSITRKVRHNRDIC
ncbi:uncharacterized protein LOC141705614 isoform X2 [Apium graveolens]|uniref:uncharacterized protein LOC141705614 isoform X2 n=1 Tax=Apium graveolens TaxID=4045 RepID=UPI003D7A5C76